MTISKVSTLVSTGWLRQQLISSARAAVNASSSLRILDTSWMPQKDVDGYREFYQQAHIPTSLHFDLKKITPSITGTAVKFPIPDPNVFQEYVEDLGISNDTHVIAYDRLDTKPSFRAWFLFRLFGHNQVSVLNGGLRQWVADGNHVTSEEPDVETGEFAVKFRPELLQDYQAMAKNVKTGSEQVIDARGSQAFHDGHIPGSKSIPFASAFNDDGTVKDVTELRKLFDAAGIDLDSPIISSCQTGMTACTIIAAAQMLGREDIPLYNGSFTEWGALASPDMIGSSTS